MEKTFLYLLVLSSLGLMTGCLQTRNDVEEAEQRKSVQQNVSSLQKNTADIQLKFSEIAEEMRSMNGKIEVLENRIGNANKEREKLHLSEEQQLTEMNKHIGLLQEELQKISQQTSFLNQEVMKLSSNASRSAPVAESKRAGKKEDILLVADAFLKNKEFNPAILEYQKYRDANPKGKKYAEATFKMGHSFQQLGMKEDAKTFYDEVIKKFPESSFAKSARERLKKLK